MTQISLLMETVFNYSSRRTKERARSSFNSQVVNKKSLAANIGVTNHLEPPQDGMMWDDYSNPGFLDKQLL